MRITTLTHADRNFLWMESLKALFTQPDEFELACAIYSFEAARDDGLTPQQAYDDFDSWAKED